MRINSKEYKNKPYYNLIRQKELIKARNRLQVQLETYNNRLVDEKIRKYHGQSSLDDHKIFSEDVIYTAIYKLNNPKIVRDFQKLIKSPLTSNDAIYKQIVRTSADKVTKVISEKETTRLLTNLKYVEKTLQQATLDYNKYETLINKLPNTVNRQKILERAITEGKMYNGRELSYKQLNNLSKDLEKYKSNNIEHQLVIDANREAELNGYDPTSTHKEWIWSQLDNTRHSEMDGTVIEVGELFTVTNEQTGDIDELRFPQDIENDTNRCSNICNCDCSIEYIKI